MRRLLKAQYLLVGKAWGGDAQAAGYFVSAERDG